MTDQIHFDTSWFKQLSAYERLENGGIDVIQVYCDGDPGVAHPDVLLKHSNDIRELLFDGDRKCAISAAITAHMWPEAILIAHLPTRKSNRSSVS
ncbi:hypothetical protein PsorP6_009881 [Peronosclerospora sorghi]|uniref:Uncharacterized protein n=1 Tax=Peronosclerospora sorghi TaxID=230839 RepID=A0ACC0VZW3_9STRA|nr:hypothetical protein PsorP6_009881 [Peronosclerospora sorghi]